MTSYFTNSYMNSDMHGHYPGNGVDLVDGAQQMHHAYNQGHGGQGQTLPYPRFPPYDRMGYYNQGMEAANTGYGARADSPSSQGVMQQQQQLNGGTGMQSGPVPPTVQQQQQQQQPVVYASCKLQAAVGSLGMVPGENGSPPLEQMGQHHMGGQMPIPHHMGHNQQQVC